MDRRTDPRWTSRDQRDPDGLDLRTSDPTSPSRSPEPPPAVDDEAGTTTGLGDVLAQLDEQLADGVAEVRSGGDPQAPTLRAGGDGPTMAERWGTRDTSASAWTEVAPTAPPTSTSGAAGGTPTSTSGATDLARPDVARPDEAFPTPPAEGGVPEGTQLGGAEDPALVRTDAQIEFLVDHGYLDDAAQADSMTDAELQDMFQDATDDMMTGTPLGPDTDPQDAVDAASAWEDANQEDAANRLLEGHGYDPSQMTDEERRDALDEIAETADADASGSGGSDTSGGSSGSGGGDGGTDTSGGGSGGGDDDTSGSDTSGSDTSGSDTDTDGDGDGGGSGDGADGGGSGDDSGGSDDSGADESEEVDLTPDPDGAVRMPDADEVVARMEAAGVRRGWGVDPTDGDPAGLDGDPPPDDGSSLTGPDDEADVPSEEALVESIVAAGPPQGGAVDPAQDEAEPMAPGATDDPAGFDLTPGDDAPLLADVGADPFSRADVVAAPEPDPLDDLEPLRTLDQAVPVDDDPGVDVLDT